MTNEEKLEIAKAKFIAKIESISTWANFKNLVNNVTKTQIKTFIKNAIQNEATKRRNIFAQEELNKADDLEALKEEVDTI